MVSAWLRLGKKYDIQYQYQTALRALQKEFPSTVDDWLFSRDDFVAIKAYVGLAFDCANIALETDTMSILPALYLSCLQDWV